MRQEPSSSDWVLPPCFGTVDSCLRGGTRAERSADRLCRWRGSMDREHGSPVTRKRVGALLLRRRRESRELCTESSTDSPTVFFVLSRIRAGTTVRFSYCCCVLWESKDKQSMVPRQGQTCRGYSYVG